MKKILLITIMGTLLLSACTNDEIKTSDKNKNSQTSNKRSNDNSEKKYIKEYQKYANKTIDEIYKLLQYVDTLNNPDEEDVSKFYLNTATNLELAKSEFNKNTNNLKAPNKYKDPVNEIDSINQGSSEGLRVMVNAINEYNNDEITEDEFSEKIEKGEKTFDKYPTKSDIDDEEIIKTLDKDTQTKIKKISDITNGEEFTNESENNESSDSFNVADDLKEVKSEDITYTQKVNNLNVNFKEMKTYKIKVTEDNEYEFENYNVGDTAYVLGIELELENTSETPQEYFIDQATIITNNQEQIDPSLITSNKIIKTDLKGKVKSSGIIYYELETSTADNLKWLDFILPEMYDDELMDVTFEEKKLRLEF
ncbi:hypothetical protein [Mammaliicoccus sciuri]|uniref:hypothetical protein n=1 Tax=Mammaliicoccus sciuri TaxID=1296 RepID=UPI002B2607DB|nr:hypothetical protein [Mammaliicoccus sciuri]WQL18494.1 hypothetical protein P3U34_05350 [Mammaliicoccus sciuri]